MPPATRSKPMTPPRRGSMPDFNAQFILAFVGLVCAALFLVGQWIAGFGRYADFDVDDLEPLSDDWEEPRG